MADLISASLLRPQAEVAEQTTDVLPRLGAAVLRAGIRSRPQKRHQLTMAVRPVGGLGGSPPPPESVSYTRSSNWRTSGHFIVPCSLY